MVRRGAAYGICLRITCRDPHDWSETNRLAEIRSYVFIMLLLGGGFKVGPVMVQIFQ